MRVGHRSQLRAWALGLSLAGAGCQALAGIVDIELAPDPLGADAAEDAKVEQPGIDGGAEDADPTGIGDPEAGALPRGDGGPETCNRIDDNNDGFVDESLYTLPAANPIIAAEDGAQNLTSNFAPDGTAIGAAWFHNTSPNEVRAIVASPDGVTASPVVAIPMGATFPYFDIAKVGAQWAVIVAGVPSRGVYLRPFDAVTGNFGATTRLDSDPNLPTTFAPQSVRAASLDANGHRYTLVTWRNVSTNSGILNPDYLRFNILEDGVPRPGAERDLASDGHQINEVRVAAAGGRFVATWTVWEEGGGAGATIADMWFATIGLDGTIGPKTKLAAGMPYEFLSTIAYDRLTDRVAIGIRARDADASFTPKWLSFPVTNPAAVTFGAVQKAATLSIVTAAVGDGMFIVGELFNGYYDFFRYRASDLALAPGTAKTAFISANTLAASPTATSVHFVFMKGDQSVRMGRYLCPP